MSEGSDPGTDNYGYSVALRGDQLLVGAPRWSSDHYTNANFYTVATTDACSSQTSTAEGLSAQAASDCVKCRIKTRGRGQVTATGGGLTCGMGDRACVARLPRGTAITLTAHPADGYAFKRRIGGGCTGTEPCTLTLDRARTVKAVFVKESQH